MSLGLSTAIAKHKVFISFHHADDAKRKKFEKKWSDEIDGFVSKSVQDGDIDPTLTTEYIRQLIRDKFIADATVTIVLIGEETWKRKYVDWEISSSIRKTKNNSRTGLIGILLPSYLSSVGAKGLLSKTDDGVFYNPHTIPPRLYDNIQCGFAKIYSWPSSSQQLKKWIDDAFKRREKCNPDSSRTLFSKNRKSTATSWAD